MLQFNPSQQKTLRRVARDRPAALALAAGTAG